MSGKKKVFGKGTNQTIVRKLNGKEPIERCELVKHERHGLVSGILKHPLRAKKLGKPLYGSFKLLSIVSETGTISLHVHCPTTPLYHFKYQFQITSH